MSRLIQKLMRFEYVRYLASVILGSILTVHILSPLRPTINSTLDTAQGSSGSVVVPADATGEIKIEGYGEPGVVVPITHKDQMGHLWRVGEGGAARANPSPNEAQYSPILVPLSATDEHTTFSSSWGPGGSYSISGAGGGGMNTSIPVYSGDGKFLGMVDTDDIRQDDPDWSPPSGGAWHHSR